ncbi:hypothetical protein B0H66DRAFT_306861 [Apodospora peruviana]|uniref:Rhodopsin domain-containing protein n=1 Tax=Apodospora peruviana TaxID=516989 RepID=A0AAE0I1I3_9PEZI|nr:hypothetical protein B0H66DRAFT_306861 [Apodospora peruviana]
MDTLVGEVGSLPRRSLLALIWTSFSTAFVFVALRTGIRFKVADRLTPEDYWIFAALAALLTLCTLETIQLPSLYYLTAVTAGSINITTDIVSKTEDYLRYEFPIVILFWTVLWCVKAAFLALYHKLFRDLPIYRRLWYVLATFTFLTYGGCVVSLSVSCGDIRNFFKFAQCARPENIFASNASVYYSTVIDVFTDLCIMAMPIGLIYNVKISAKQKAGLVAVFGLCFVMIAFAIIRAKQVLVPQFFVNLTMLMVWSTLAASVSVIVGSLPALKILLANRASAKRTRYGSSGAGSGKHGRSGKQQSNANRPETRSKGVPLNSFSSDKKSIRGRGRPDTGDSQEEILQGDRERDTSNFVLVQHDVTVSYTEMDRPSPVYQQTRKPPPAPTGYGVAI